MIIKPKTAAELSIEVDRLLGLPDDWDSYGASPPHPIAGERIKELLEYLESEDLLFKKILIGPLPNGGFQIEWSCNHKDLEIEIPSSYDFPFLTLCIERSNIYDYQYIEGEIWNLTELADLVKWVLE